MDQALMAVNVLLILGKATLFTASAVFGAKIGFAVLRLTGARRGR